jgi:hypothetical protein
MHLTPADSTEVPNATAAAKSSPPHARADRGDQAELHGRVLKPVLARGAASKRKKRVEAVE